MGTASASVPRTPLRTRLQWFGVRVGGVLVVLVIVRVLAYAVGKENARAILDDRAESTLVERRDYLAARLEDVSEQTAPGGQFGGEWVLVTLSMTALASANLAFTYPDTVPTAKTIVERCAELALAKSTRAFDTARWDEDALDSLDGTNPHIGYLGHLALILEAKRILGASDDAHEKPVLAALRRRVAAAKAPILETYPGERYTADNMVVFAALAMAAIDAPGHGERSAENAPSVKRFVDWVTTRLIDPKSDAIVFLTNDDGTAKGHARGSGVGWSGLYLPFLDRALAKRQATALHDHFRKSLAPFGGAVCEYDGCTPGAGDVDSGPVVLGTSPSGTGFAFAAARTLGDERWLDDMLSTAEWVGVTASISGKRRFLLAPLVGDAVVVAALSTRSGEVVWDGRYLSR